MRDSLDADLDRWQNEQDEDYINPSDAALERLEHLADSMDEADLFNWNNPASPHHY